MSDLDYTQAAVLCRVPGMPFQEKYCGSWHGRQGDSPYYVREHDTHRLTPEASLTPEQAAICLAMGVKLNLYRGGFFHSEIKLGQGILGGTFKTEEIRVPPSKGEEE